jgi:hypothetical protein
MKTKSIETNTDQTPWWEKMMSASKAQREANIAAYKASLPADDPGSRNLTDEELKILHAEYKKGMAKMKDFPILDFDFRDGK